MYINKLKEKLKTEKLSTGVILHSQSIDFVEILGLIGYDCVFIDCEHGELSPHDCVPLILAAERRGVTPLIRVPNKDEKTILRYLEVGAMGIILPTVESEEEMKQIIEYAKYYPQGGRGVAFMRASDYGIGSMSGEDCRQMANREIMMIPMIETVEGVKNAREIMSVEGVDSIIVGTNDLAQSMKLPGKAKSEEVMSEVKKVIEIGVELGVPVAHNAGYSEDITPLLEKGLKLVFTGGYGLVAAAGKEFLNRVKS